MVQRTGRATYQDILDAPEEKVAELIDGELFLSPRPASPHAICSAALGALLVDAFWFGRSGPGGWFILDEPELHFDDRETILVPDLAGWRRERMPAPPQSAGLELPPDWLCEILSPGTAIATRRCRSMRRTAFPGCG
jgi:Uma2 family endonuclease